jgi:hypothetical protein
MTVLADVRAQVCGPRSALRLRSRGVSALALVVWGCWVLPGAGAQAVKTPYPEMAPVEQYMMPESAEVALARSAAPASISANADVMVLRRDGYATAVKGTSGWVCAVERGWANNVDAPDYWNPKQLAPHCFNPPAARSFLPIYLMKTKMVMSGERSKERIAQAVEAAFKSGKLPPLERGAAAYMMSKQQYLGDRDQQWHPHVMFYSPGDETKTWGADSPDSPVLAANDPEEHVTILFVVADKWSDGTPGPLMRH